MNKTAIGIGSNINPVENIRLGIKKLKDIDPNLVCSSKLQTEPLGIKNQSDFINCAVYLRTEFSKDELNSELKRIEDELLRDRSAPKFGPRTLDLDIIIWNNEVVDKDYHEREFVKNCVDQVYPFEC